MVFRIFYTPLYDGINKIRRYVYVWITEQKGTGTDF